MASDNTWKRKSIQDVPLHLVGQMLNLWEDKWANETENEIDMNWLRVDNKFHQMNPFYEHEYI
jgi:hypothetical protein